MIHLADVWALTLMAVGGVLLCWIATRVAERQDVGFLTRTIALTVLVRAGWSYFQHNVIGEYYSRFASDALARFYDARSAAVAWHEGLRPHIPATLQESHSQLITLKTTVLIYLFGPSPMLGESVSVVSNVSILIAVYLICRHLKATPLATRVAVLLNAFLPSLVYWSTQDLKDPLLAACGAWGLVALLQVLQDWRRVDALLLLLVSDLVGLIYRPYVGILLITGQGMAWACVLRLPKTPLWRFARIVMFVGLTTGALAFGVAQMKEVYGEQMSVDTAVEMANAGSSIAQGKAGNRGSDYEIPLSSDPKFAVLELPLRLLLLLLSPIPIFPGTLLKTSMFPEMWFLYLWAVPRFVHGIREAWRKNRRALTIILVTIGPIAAAYALQTSVAGQAARVRAQFLPELLIFAGIGHAVVMRMRDEAREAYRLKMQWPLRRPAAAAEASSGDAGAGGAQ